MAEYLKIATDEFSYTGLVSISGFFKFMKNFLLERGYDFHEQKHTEQVFEDGKDISLYIQGDRKASDLAKINWELSLKFQGCQEVTVEIEGRPVKMHKATMTLWGGIFVKSSYDKTFEQNAFLYFVRTILDKYVVKSYLSQLKAKGKQDFEVFFDQAKSFVNLEKFN